MRDLAIETLKDAKKDIPISRVVEINDGVPIKTPLNLKELGSGDKKTVTFESEPGFTTPAILVLPKETPRGVRIIIDDAGKHTRTSDGKPDGLAHFYLDVLGTGELKDIELRYPIYLGRSVAFIAAWQIVRAKDALQKYSTKVEIEAHGPLSTLAALYANILDPGFTKTAATDALEKWQDVFNPGVPPAAVQPRANLLPQLDRLRAQVKNATWTFLPTE